MGLISTGIDEVRTFELPNGVWEGGSAVAAPRAALVRWHASGKEKFYQVYVNGEYAGGTVDSQQRQLVVHTPTSVTAPVRIEVFAVEAAEAGTNFSGKIGLSSGRTGRVRMILLRGQNLPIGSSAQIYSDNGAGEIDYDSPLSSSPIRVWPTWQDKAGFGMSRFGASDFGYDSAAAVGFGKGSFGRGQFGLDADTIEWISQPLEAGVYKFAITIADAVGNESSSETDQIAVVPDARPAEQVSVSSFDKQANQLVLSVS
jgi:hypothetical protein